MASRMGKYFRASEREAKHGSPDFQDYRRRAEEWVRRNPAASITIAALAGAMLISSPALRKLAIPMLLIGLRRWMR